MVPGGQVQDQLEDEAMLRFLRDSSAAAELTTTVCNGSHLLAASGVLDGRNATTNKLLFTQIADAQPNVNWVAEARWVDDGDIVSASGVSAGIDTSLHVVARLFGEETAELLAQGTEYEWHRDPGWDPFAAKAVSSNSPRTPEPRSSSTPSRRHSHPCARELRRLSITARGSGSGAALKVIRNSTRPAALAPSAPPTLNGLIKPMNVIWFGPTTVPPPRV